MQQNIFYEHRLHKCTIKYETGICLDTERQCWVSGGWPGSFNDLTIARTSGILDLLDAAEKILADKGYVGDERILSPFRPTVYRWQKQFNDEIKRYRQVVERLHGRIKDFACLRIPFRHPIPLHSRCYYAVCNIVAIDCLERPLTH